MPRFQPGQRVRALRTIHQLVTEGSEWVVANTIPREDGRFDIVVSDVLREAPGYGGFNYLEDDFEPASERFIGVWVRRGGAILPDSTISNSIQEAEARGIATVTPVYPTYHVIPLRSIHEVTHNG